VTVRRRVPPPKLALTVEHAAEALDMGQEKFREIAPELRWVRRGRTKRVAVRELERWLTENAETTTLAELFADDERSSS
jgi:hypothetical protein